MSLSLMVVDDAPFIREVVRVAVQGANSPIDVVGEAEDGEEAVEMALKLSPDIILMDMALPRRNGLEAAKLILHAKPEQRIIAFSTLSEPAFIEKVLGAGCVAFVKKPFEAKELLDAIEASAGR